MRLLSVRLQRGCRAQANTIRLNGYLQIIPRLQRKAFPDGFGHYDPALSIKGDVHASTIAICRSVCLTGSPQGGPGRHPQHPDQRPVSPLLSLDRLGVSADTAMRLARYFGGDARSWLNLQTAYDLRKAEQAGARRIEREIVPVG